MSADQLKSYGVRNMTQLESDVDRFREEIAIKGFTVVPDVVPESELEEARKRIDTVYAAQASEVGGEENLRKINDALVGRCLMAYDDYFLGFATNKKIHAVVGSLLGDYFTILQQNAVINAPSDKHYQTAWHRDLAYQHFVSSKPLALSALFCIDDFSEVTGGTYMLPGSHKSEPFPSSDFIAAHELTVNAKAGCALVFDSMIYHRGGINRSKGLRRGVNHLFGLPFIKQQISFPRSLGGKYRDDPSLSRFLGYDTEAAESVLQWRTNRLEAAR
ncbi:MAG TPA: phytanoyl-CoA dioxygenase family protein [Chthoniobacterales bacterium]|nr:phytanoyl-CoA dioxygenase family protein [Chthoniobacterales bacterium]